jgi:sulfide:quinone oxidoreductase
MEKTILVLGGGTGGIITAHELTRKLPKSKNDNFKVILFEKEERSVFAPSLLWLMVGMRKPLQVLRPVKNLSKKGIQLIQGTIEYVDPVSKS